MRTTNVITSDIVVIGGGASGMMAAIAAAEQGARVVLLEKNQRLGEKLRITGGGRCNITNVEPNTRILLSHYGKADKYLHAAFARFGVKETISFFERIGVPIKIEARQRAFPVSESAEDVTNALIVQLKRNNVDIRVGCRIESVFAHNGIIQSISSNTTTFNADAYILATGGTSRPETGATGDGMDWLRALTHTIRDATPTITPLASKEPWVHDLSGASIQNVDVIFYCDDVRSFKIHGNVLCTHFGISGPTILNSAYKVAELLSHGEVRAEIDCYPSINHKQLDASIIQTLQEHRTKQVKNTLRYIAPQGLRKALETLLSSDPMLDTTCSELSKESRLKIVALLKALPIQIDGLMGMEKAVVADGGVTLSEIDTRTMRSKLLHNLYITGDLLDITRPSGGYSLQLCWTTGYLAGIHAITDAKNPSQ